MAKINDLLIQKENESIEAFDRRISSAPYQHIGYAFFDCANYDSEKHIFSLYVIWNDKINSLLEDPFPPTGFVIHCSIQMSECLIFENCGIPIFAKLHSMNGIINATNMLIRYFDRNYVVSYTGTNAVVPENVYFKGISSVDAEKYEGLLDLSGTTGSYNGSSFNVTSFTLNNFAKSSFYAKYISAGSFNLGSFNLGSFGLGSYNLGSFKSGLFNLSSFNLGSFSLGSYNLGSFNLGSFNLSSFNSINWSLFNLGSYNLGSFNLGSFNLGSFKYGYMNLGSYNSSSFNLNSFGLGSFTIQSILGGSYKASSFNLGSSRPFVRSNVSSSYNVISDNQLAKEIFQGMPYEELLKEIFGIGFMGYGLNLI